MSDTDLRREDDVLVSQMQKDLKKLEEAVSQINTRHDTIMKQISSEADDHMFIKGKVEGLNQKLQKIEECMINLKEDRAYRDGQLQQVIASIEGLNSSINTINGILNEFQTGTHAAVHKWAESQIEAERHKEQFRDKIKEVIITKTASAIILVILTLIGLGFVEWIKSITTPLP